MECPYCDQEMEVMGADNVCHICRLSITITAYFPQTAQTKLSFFLKPLQLSNHSVSYVVKI